MQLLVLGGNGFVGSHVCKEALECGLNVSSISRYDISEEFVKLNFGSIMLVLNAAFTKYIFDFSN